MFGFFANFWYYTNVFYISPPVSFADSPLVRGGLLKKPTFLAMLNFCWGRGIIWWMNPFWVMIGGETVVYCLDGLHNISAAEMERAMELVPQSRREYAARYRFERDRVQSIFAFLLLRYAVRLEYGVETPLEFDRSGGKPTLLGLEELHFNLSHCDTAVACALSAAPVGVDVQHEKDFHWSVAKRVCCPEELAFLQSAEAPDREFAKLWTRKESYGKYTGQGIVYPMEQICLLDRTPDGTVMETFTFDGYALSYCAEESLEICKVSVETLIKEPPHLM